MPDPRPAHMTQSLLNTPTAPFPGAGAALYPNHRYGNRGPERIQAKAHEPPGSIEALISEAVGRVANLSTKQRNAVAAEVLRLTRDLHFIRQVMEEAKAKGPWSAEAAHPTDEGRVL